MSTPHLRLGIDVGGTFTDVVAIDAASRALVASVKVPTTHSAPTGVAQGIIDGIDAILARNGIPPADVSFIAHSTTQATNALLEGDVASVGVLGLLDVFSPLARMQMRFPMVELAPGVPFRTTFAFAKACDAGRSMAQLQSLYDRGAAAVAVSQAFAVDRPAAEQAAVEYARGAGGFATAGHEVSSMYGLRARTRTAALNAAILPKMVRTAQMTTSAVTRAGITAPLMIMRSDGGVMDVREMERRPILTMLSGPAAGVAGALLHENVTEGVFIEVGGTSSDCSAIRAGMPQMRPARVGGHRTMLRTLDVRTLAIAGGSMVRAGDKLIRDVGPRSAHIAGLTYAAFADPGLFKGARAVRVRPLERDPADYVAIAAADGTKIALTTTCAANALGYVPEDAFAFGNAEAAKRGFEVLGADLGADPMQLARTTLDIACAKLISAIEELIADYQLDPQTLAVVGGGGGAAALVPYAAQRLKLEFRLARNAEVISPIGVALALVREVVERIVVNPSPQDILRIRREAQDAVVASGASADRVEVAVEIDAQRNLVRAVASGASELAETAARAEQTEEELLVTAAALLRTQPEYVERIAQTHELVVFRSAGIVRVIDRHGVARLTLRDPVVWQTTAAKAHSVLEALLDDATAFGDAGRALPDIYLADGARIADFSGLASAQDALALADEELLGRSEDAAVILFAVKKIG